MKHGTTRKTQTMASKPLQPCVSLEQIYAYDPERPETYTPSPLMNAILEAMCAVCPLSSTALGKYLAVDPRKLTSAIFLLTGMEYAEMREKWGKNRIARLREEHPDWTLNQLARAAGYASHSAVWRTEHRYKRKQEYREKQAYLHHSRESRIMDMVNFYKDRPNYLQELKERDRDELTSEMKEVLRRLTE